MLKCNLKYISMSYNKPASMNVFQYKHMKNLSSIIYYSQNGHC
ncbi:protein of unknown function [Petrocella atlantisensis]|uniref:Uncharacterized protein n=1 Tax=Petrocella atlantisensis TaxID=2173034 RepID=A0A3P7P2P1_9FIRM|nr:protein of unknown function [Petrocella atlantisensis]